VFAFALRLGLIGGALWALRRELAGLRAPDVWRHLKDVGIAWLSLALLCTVASFALLGVLERLALQYAGRERDVPPGTSWRTSFVAHALSQSLGLALLTGAAVRLRAYARRGLDVADVARVSAFVTITVSLGLLVTGAGALLASRAPLHVAGRWLPVRSGGLALALVVGAYLAWSVLGAPTPASRARWRLPHVSPAMAGAQLATSASDWLLTGTVLWALIAPSTGIGYLTALRVFLVAQVLAVASHIPGGVGVFEAVVLALAPTRDSEHYAALVAALVLYRVVYYLVPLVAAGIVAAVSALAHRHATHRLDRASISRPADFVAASDAHVG
jgi:phosphatidylglycerol lysyltransferase